MTNSKKKTDLSNRTKCESCGKPLIVSPTSKGRIPRFCSPGCRVGWHRGKRPPAENLPSLAELLGTLDELTEGNHSFDREITTIKKILIEYFKDKK